MTRPARATVDPFATLRDAIVEIVRAEVAKLAPAPPVDDYLTVNAAAAFASVAPGTIRRWVRDGSLAEHRAGRVLRVRRSELERLLSAPPSRAKRGRDDSPEALARRRFG